MPSQRCSEPVLLEAYGDMLTIVYLEQLLAALIWLRRERMWEKQPPTPRLDLWAARWRRQGKPAHAEWAMDGLWRAACREAAALEAWYAGDPESAYDLAAEAAALVPVRRR